MRKPALIALEDGTIFHGESIGCDGQSVGEVVFNTAMTGYQEILTDASYYKQIVTLTYPHIGNVGTNQEDQESNSVWASGLVIRDLPQLASSWRSDLNLEQYLKSKKVVAIAGIDTRQLTRHLREKGAQNGCIEAGKTVNEAKAEAKAIAAAQAFPGLEGMDLAKHVTTDNVYQWKTGAWTLDDGLPSEKSEADLPHHVVVYDFGVKRNILRLLVDKGCRLTVVPATTPAAEIISLRPDGVFLSNGPGDPQPCDYALAAISDILITDIPVFGICLGHQLLALASGAETKKMKFGHHGANHPVQDLASGEVVITSQNHGFAVTEESLPSNLRASHRSLFDGSLQGIHHADKPAFGFQGHPEASPGPHDVQPLFDHFVELIKTRKLAS